MKVNSAIFFLFATILVIGIVFIYAKYNPIENAWFPQCPIKKVTGLNCPACGSQRALHSLLNGKILEALSFNYFYIIAIPCTIMVIISYVLGKLNKHLRLIKILEKIPIFRIYLYGYCAWFIYAIL